jgi:glycerate 2-kinase
MASLRDTARTIFHDALADCNVEQAMARHIHARNGCLYLDGDEFNPEELEHIRIVAVGKAANGMMQAVSRELAALPCRDIAGVVIAPEPPSQLPDGFALFAGGHPLPTQASFAGARAALDLLGALPAKSPNKALCIFLISGGASAMMELPLDPAISLADTVKFHRALVGCGASITDINCIRKHFSAVKGGRLALAANGAAYRSFLISDVPAGHEDALGSGPTVPDRSTIADCREILARYALLAQFPVAVQEFFHSSALPETPKSPQLRVKTAVVLGPHDLARAAARRAHALGFTPVIDDTCNDWEYRASAKCLLERLRVLRREHSRVCLISVGEASVGLPSQPAARIGIGGRNQQFAVYAATLLRREDGQLAVLSAGSDGIDGNSPAAGAVVDQSTLDEGAFPHAQQAASDALAEFNAFPFLEMRNATILTRSTGNNLRDLRILLA